MSRPPWRVFAGACQRGARAMALDRVAADVVDDGGPWTVRVYAVRRRTFTLGYRQATSVVDRRACRRHGVSVVRRATGGSTLFHAPNVDVIYSVAVDRDWAPTDARRTYAALAAPLVWGLRSLGVPVAFATESRPAAHESSCKLAGTAPDHDLVGPDGHKLAGNAQRRRRDVVRQHGAAFVGREPTVHADCLADDVDPATVVDRTATVGSFVDASPARVAAAVAAGAVAWCRQAHRTGRLPVASADPDTALASPPAATPAGATSDASDDGKDSARPRWTYRPGVGWQRGAADWSDAAWHRAGALADEMAVQSDVGSAWRRHED